jgi:hypothetical protein
VDWEEIPLFPQCHSRESVQLLKETLSEEERNTFALLYGSMSDPVMLRKTCMLAQRCLSRVWEPLCITSAARKYIETQYFGKSESHNYAVLLGYIIKLHATRELLIEAYFVINQRNALIETVSESLRHMVPHNYGLLARCNSRRSLKDAAEHMGVLYQLTWRLQNLLVELKEKQGEWSNGQAYDNVKLYVERMPVQMNALATARQKLR